ncbi:MAG: hypothetical protein ACKVW3_11750 [Phycisphaerales bacterium]
MTGSNAQYVRLAAVDWLRFTAALVVNTGAIIVAGLLYVEGIRREVERATTSIVGMDRRLGEQTGEIRRQADEISGMNRSIGNIEGRLSQRGQ